MKPHSQPTDTINRPCLDPQQWLVKHGDYLYHFAIRQIRQTEVAEDLVQETLLAAWRGRAKYAGYAQERSWLTGILKRKMIDWLRATVRERAHRVSLVSETDAWAERRFDSAGRWAKTVEPWMSEPPESELQRQEFWQVFQTCSDKLPTRLRQVVALWYLEDRPHQEVCEMLGVTPANVWVSLHRARLRLWNCLSVNWFGETPTSSRNALSEGESS